MRCFDIWILQRAPERFHLAQFHSLLHASACEGAFASRPQTKRWQTTRWLLIGWFCQNNKLISIDQSCKHKSRFIYHSLIWFKFSYFDDIWMLLNSSTKWLIVMHLLMIVYWSRAVYVKRRKNVSYFERYLLRMVGVAWVGWGGVGWRFQLLWLNWDLFAQIIRQSQWSFRAWAQPMRGGVTM